MTPSWITTAFCVVLTVSLIANFMGVVWSIFRELTIRKLSDTLMSVATNASKTLAEMQAGIVQLCKRIDEDRTIRMDAKEDIRREIERTGQHIGEMLGMMMTSIRGSGSVNIKGSAQFNDGDGEQR